MKYRTVSTICPYCGVGCGLLLQVMDGLLIGTLPLKNHPISKGRLCLKGWNAHQFVHHPDRLPHPLIRKGGALQEASWEEALECVGRGFSKIRDEFGPASLAGLSSAKCTNEENYLFQKLMRGILGTNNVDHCARLCHSPTVVALTSAFGSAAMTNSIPELADAACILVFGSNTTENHPLVASFIIEAQRRGGRLLVADPRKIHLSMFADLHLRNRPGTDAALANGLAHVILEEGLHNRQFIEERTEGFEAFKEAIQEYPPTRVEEIAGVSASQIKEAARLYAQAERASIVYCMGITQHAAASDQVRAICNLALLCGHVGRPSTGVNPLRGQNNVQGACDMGALPDVLSGYQRLSDPEVREKFEKNWKLALPSETGKTLMEIISGAGKDIRGLYIMGENPILSDPDSEGVRQALARLDFLVVQDIFLSETAALAHVVLPSASFAEKEGTFTNTDRRVQLLRKAVDPPGSALADWEILCRVAAALGCPQDYESPEKIMEEISALTPSYGGIKYSRLMDKGLQWPCPDEAHPGTRYLHAERFARGKGKFHPVRHRPHEEFPDEEYPFRLLTGRMFCHYHTGTMTRKSPALSGEQAQGYAEINPEDAMAISIKEGQKVRVTSRRGSIQVPARVTGAVEKGEIFIPFHFAESAANVLTQKALDPESKMPELKVCAVRLEKAE
jgi:formate dehydrogenase alpha subunit